MVVNSRARMFNNQYMEQGRHLCIHKNGVLHIPVVHTLNIKVHTKKMAFRRSDYL